VVADDKTAGLLRSPAAAAAAAAAAGRTGGRAEVSCSGRAVCECTHEARSSGASVRWQCGGSCGSRVVAGR